MSRTNERIRESRRLAAGLGLSGAALAGLIYFEGMSTRPIEEVAEDAIDGLAVFTVEDADEPAIAVPVAVEVEVAVAEVDVAAPLEPVGPALVVVPDIERMNLRQAAKRVAELGLKLSVRDEYGEKIPRWAWGGYQVRAQHVEAGTEVVPGSTVKAKVREPKRVASGY